MKLNFPNDILYYNGKTKKYKYDGEFMESVLMRIKVWIKGSRARGSEKAGVLSASENPDKIHHHTDELKSFPIWKGLSKIWVRTSVNETNRPIFGLNMMVINIFN